MARMRRPRRGLAPPIRPPRARPDFSSRVLAVARQIPAGFVATYGDVAERAGRPLASRAVGNIMSGCHDPGVPCHRVVAAGGGLGGYGSELSLKRQLLRAEGVIVEGLRIRRFAQVRWAFKRRS